MNGNLKKFFLKFRNVISAIVYMMLVFVVIYGISNGVYDGFPVIIPYIIIAIFIFMSFMRLYQWVISSPSNKDSDETSKSKKQ